MNNEHDQKMDTRYIRNIQGNWHHLHIQDNPIQNFTTVQCTTTSTAVIYQYIFNLNYFHTHSISELKYMHVGIIHEAKFT